MLEKRDYEGYRRLEDVFHKKTAGRYISDVILGANDGIVTTFVIVAGAVGAHLDPVIILVLGFANVLGDAASMGFGKYLGDKSEAQYNQAQRKQEEWEIEKYPDIESWEIEEIFSKWGFEGNDLKRAVEIVTSNKKVWTDIMMTQELGIVEEKSQPMASGLATFIAFTLAGSLPLIPFITPGLREIAPLSATVIAGIELFVIGALRSVVAPQKWIKAGAEMLVVGAVAGGIAYGVGYFVDRIVGSIV